MHAQRGAGCDQGVTAVSNIQDGGTGDLQQLLDSAVGLHSWTSKYLIFKSQQLQYLKLLTFNDLIIFFKCVKCKCTCQYVYAINAHLHMFCLFKNITSTDKVAGDLPEIQCSHKVMFNKLAFMSIV